MPPDFDAATGEIREPGERPKLHIVEDPEIRRLKAELEAAEKQIQALERDLRGKRSAITRLLDQKEQDRKAYTRREEVELWFQVWKVATNHPRSALGPDRFDAIRKGIELGYTIENWELVCEFAGRLPFGFYYDRKPTGKENQRRDEPHLLIKHFETFARQEWEYRRNRSS